MSRLVRHVSFEVGPRDSYVVLLEEARSFPGDEVGHLAELPPVAFPVAVDKPTNGGLVNGLLLGLRSWKDLKGSCPEIARPWPLGPSGAMCLPRMRPTGRRGLNTRLCP